ncbi:MAG: hypothetical protein AAF518_23480 [Spirochaetota bacterium]
MSKYNKDEQMMLFPLEELSDENLALNRGENRIKLVKEWQRLTGKSGTSLSILCGELTALEYKVLFGTSNVVVVAKDAWGTEKKILNNFQILAVAHVEKEHLDELKRYQGFLGKYSIKKKLMKTCQFVKEKRNIKDIE